MNAFFYKEWLKNRWFYMLSAIFSLLLCLYVTLNLHRLCNLRGAAHFWEAALTKDAIFIQLLHYMPLLLGIAAALVQFIPEMLQKRIKLTLHLPCNYFYSIGSMLLFGLCMLCCIFLLNLSALGIALRSIFAPEIVSHILLTALPWYLSGLTAYVLCAWICLEPNWKRRVLNGIVSACILRIFFMSDTPEAYNRFLPILAVYTLLICTLPFISVERFKTGKD